MKPVRCIVLGVAALAGWALMPEAIRALSVGAHLTIDLLTPGNWRCLPDPTAECATCQNLTGHIGEIAVRCAADGPAAHRTLLPGEELFICCSQPPAV